MSRNTPQNKNKTNKNKRFQLPVPNLEDANEWGNFVEKVDPVFENWQMPDISSPTKIAEVFPVTVTELPERNTYKITWNFANLNDWRRTKPESWDEFQDYDEYVLRRLKYALAYNSDMYKELPIERPDELFRIRVVGELVAPRRNTTVRRESANLPRPNAPRPNAPRANAPRANAPGANTNGLPQFYLLNDIKNYYPVVWHKDPYNPKVLGIQLHKMKTQGMAKEAGQSYKNFESNLRSTIVRALQKSEGTGAWRVMPSLNKDYICMLHLQN